LEREGPRLPDADPPPDPDPDLEPDPCVDVREELGEEEEL
jgi:hypothetical protein